MKNTSIINIKVLAAAKAQRNSLKGTEKEVNKLAIKIEELKQEYEVKSNMYNTMKASFENAYLKGMNLNDVVILKEEGKFNNQGDLMANPKGINNDGKFDLDLLAYNLKNNSNFREIPADSNEEEVTEETLETEKEEVFE